MKHIILAPLLSAFILPGLGQVVNGQFRKARAVDSLRIGVVPGPVF